MIKPDSQLNSATKNVDFVAMSVVPSIRQSPRGTGPFKGRAPVPFLKHNHANIIGLANGTGRDPVPSRFLVYVSSDIHNIRYFGRPIVVQIPKDIITIQIYQCT